MKLIIDCDVGVDDAYAILLASVTDDVEILAINVVSGNSTLENCAINTKLVVDQIFHGKPKPPIYLGAKDPIIKDGTIHGDSYHGFDGLAGVRDILFKKEIDEIKRTFSQTNTPHASIKILELVTEYPNEVTIVSLGPLTNLALAVKLSTEPDAFTKSIKSLVIMGGNELCEAKPENIEFNFSIDPYAAKIVTEEYKCPITICTFEMTIKHFKHIDLELVFKALNVYCLKSEKCKFMQSIAFYRETADDVLKDYISCDFIAMLIALRRDECKTVLSSHANCTVDIDRYKGLISSKMDSTLAHGKINFVVGFDKDIILHYIIDCFKKLAEF